VHQPPWLLLLMAWRDDASIGRRAGRVKLYYRIKEAISAGEPCHQQLRQLQFAALWRPASDFSTLRAAGKRLLDETASVGRCNGMDCSD